jgi:hypothetical protein
MEAAGAAKIRIQGNHSLRLKTKTDGSPFVSYPERTWICLHFYKQTVMIFFGAPAHIQAIHFIRADAILVITIN